MGDITSSWFNLPFGIRVSNDNPVDGNRYLATDQAERFSVVDNGRAFNGLQVYQQDTNKLYLLIDKQPTGAGSVWVEMQRGDSNAGSQGSNDIQFAATAADGSFVKIDDISPHKWYLDDTPGIDSLVFTDSGGARTLDTIPGFNFYSARDITIGATLDGSGIMGGLRLIRSRGIGNELQTNDGGVSIRIETSNINAVIRDTIVIHNVLADQTGFNPDNAHESDLFIATARDTPDPGLENAYKFGWDGTFGLLRASSSSGSESVLTIDGSGDVHISSKTEDNIGGGGGAIIDAFTSIRIQNNDQVSAALNLSGAEELRIEVSATGPSAANQSPLIIGLGSGTSNKFVNIQLIQTNIDHQFLKQNANEHIDHSNVNIIAGVGLIGGGNITSDVTLSIDTNSGINVDHSQIQIIGGQGLSNLAGDSTIDGNVTLNLDISGLNSFGSLNPEADFLALTGFGIGSAGKFTIKDIFNAVFFQGGTPNSNDEVLLLTNSGTNLRKVRLSDILNIPH